MDWLFVLWSNRSQTNDIINSLINNFKLYKLNNNSLYYLQNIFKQI